MNLSNQTKLLLLIIGILIFILFINNFYNKKPIKNAGNLQSSYPIIEEENDVNIKENTKYIIDENDTSKKEVDNNSLKDNDNIDSKNKILEQIYKKKTTSRNKAKDGEYKKSNYTDSKRGNNVDNTSEFDSFFDENNGVTKDVYANNDTFTGNDETQGKFASYKSGKKIKMTTDEMFNIQNLLPQEQKEDWFEVMPEAISVKNKHLINLSRPIGINTIGTSNKNPSYDLRGTIINPKTIVAPWLQSSIEPDINNKGLSGC